MEKTHISQKVVFSALAGMIIIPGSALRVSAAEEAKEQPFVQTAGIESVLDQCYETEVKDNINLISGTNRRGRVFEYGIF